MGLPSPAGTTPAFNQPWTSLDLVSLRWGKYCSWVLKFANGVSVLPRLTSSTFFKWNSQVEWVWMAGFTTGSLKLLLQKSRTSSRFPPKQIDFSKGDTHNAFPHLHWSIPNIYLWDLVCPLIARGGDSHPSPQPTTVREVSNHFAMVAEAQGLRAWFETIRSDG